MAKTIEFDRSPTESDLSWFTKHVGPRTHYTQFSIGGEGWCFTFTRDNPWSRQQWMLTIENEEMLTYFLLAR